MTAVASILFPIALLSILAYAPFWSVKQHRIFLREVEEGLPDLRVSAFAGTMKVQWPLTVLLLGLWLMTRSSFESVYLVPGWSGLEWIAVAAGLLAAGLAVFQTAFVARRPRWKAKMREALGDLVHIAPRNRRELRWFDGVSVTAGVCEEIVYRGLLLGTLSAWIGLWPAVVVSSLMFGLAHAYQGPAGALRIVGFGFVAALLTVFSGSVYLMILVHTVVDMAQGRMIAAAVDGPPAEGPLPAVGNPA